MYSRTSGTRQRAASHRRFICVTHNARLRGGVTFTMVIFVLLLCSTGLMYFYFQRCQQLESELVQYRKGKTPAAVQGNNKSTKDAITDVVTGMRDKLVSQAGAKPSSTPDTTSTLAAATETPDTALPASSPTPETKPAAAIAASTPPSNETPELPEPGKLLVEETAKPEPFASTKTTAAARETGDDAALAADNRQTQAPQESDSSSDENEEQAATTERSTRNKSAGSRSVASEEAESRPRKTPAPRETSSRQTSREPSREKKSREAPIRSIYDLKESER